MLLSQNISTDIIAITIVHCFQIAAHSMFSCHALKRKICFISGENLEGTLARVTHKAIRASPFQADDVMNHRIIYL